MCDQTEIEYLDGEVVWVKLGSCWWPGAVVGSDKLPPGLLSSFRKPPIAVVQFFQEDTYEYVKNINLIYKYNCSRKNEFIKKGLDAYRTKHGHMEKFPEDIVRAETVTGGDPDILSSEEFQESKKESYAGLFGDKKPPATPGKRGRGAKGRQIDSPKIATPVRKFNKGNSDYKVHILVQPKHTTEHTDVSTPTTSRAGSEPLEDRTDKSVAATPTAPAAPASPATPAAAAAAGAGIYSCHSCPYTSTRLNLMILHNKSHSAGGFAPYTPSPIRKKPTAKQTPNALKTPKQRRPRIEKTEKTDKSAKKAQGKKRAADGQGNSDTKKPKTDEEIKTSLLADWDDAEEEPAQPALPTSPELPVGAEPALPTPTAAEPALPTPTAAATPLPSTPSEPAAPSAPAAPPQPDADKPECSKDAKYDFCEDEDWPVEELGRKIPRIKNSKRKSDSKSLSLDDDDVAKEVAELLSSTTVPELPSAPEPLKVEENFPERPIEKSPDKSVSAESDKPTETQPTKTIFKTKTFFRSRHSRSQDAIGKYVAEQLNAAERMNTSDCELNGSEAASSPELGEPGGAGASAGAAGAAGAAVRVARLAPKIQLKRMKAEAAQQEREKALAELVAHDARDDKDTMTLNNFSSIESPEPVVAESAVEAEEVNTTVVSNESEKQIEPEDATNMKDDVVSCEPAVEIPPKSNSMGSFISSSTARAVDALLSVSRDADRVTRTVSDLVPEDMFEEDPKADAALCSAPTTVDNENNHEITENRDITAVDEVNGDSVTLNNISETISNGKDQVGEPGISAVDSVNDSAPTESDLQIAEALINLPSSALKNKSNDILLEAFERQMGEEVAAALAEHAELTKPAQAQQHVHAEQTADAKHAEHAEKAELAPHATHAEQDPHAEQAVPAEHATLEPAEVKANQPELSIQEIEIDDVKFPMETEVNENLNAAQSLVQMSETLELSVIEANDVEKTPAAAEPAVPGPPTAPAPPAAPATPAAPAAAAEETIEHKLSLMSETNNSEPTNGNAPKFKTTSSKLLKMLEEPCAPMMPLCRAPIIRKTVAPVQGNEKILNFGVGTSPVKPKPQVTKQKIIIRRTGPTKTLINSLSEPSKQEKIILSRSNKGISDGSSVQTYTIQASPDAAAESNTIIIQQKMKKVPPPKLQKVKPQTSLIAISSEPPPSPSVPATPAAPAAPATLAAPAAPAAPAEDALFDINSMPIVLSDDILTPENIDKMPIVMSDGNLVTNQVTAPAAVAVTPKPVKQKPNIIEKVISAPKTEVKTLLMNPISEVCKSTTPNILSKSAKLRSAKPMLVIDKTTGKQKIIMTKSEPAKEFKQATKLQNVSQVAGKTEKFIILPTSNSPRPTRTQKIVIDPATGKAHVLSPSAPATGAGGGTGAADTKPVSARLVAGGARDPAAAAGAAPAGGTVMIITNAQGTQSRIVLTPEHEKLLFPKKQTNITQLKATPPRLTLNATSKPQTIVAAVTQSHIKTQTKIVPKQKGTIITSKGQLIIGGRLATTSQNIAPMPEIRPAATKRVIASEPKKITQTVHGKTNTEPLIFLQQKSGAVMQLTAAQFEHLQRTGQIVQKTAAPTKPQENKVIVQKSVTITSNSALPPVIQKQQRARMARAAASPSPSPSPAKKLKQEIIIKSATASPMPSLTPIVKSATPPRTPTKPAPVTTASSPYPDLDNFEEMLPSTAIARPEPAKPIEKPRLPELAPAPALAPPPEPELPPAVPEPEPAPQADAAPALADSQLLAVPGEHFGGPLGSFYLCVEDNGLYTPIDNRPLVLENNQLVPMAVEMVAPQPERRDILEAALANSDVFHEPPPPLPLPPPRDEAPDFRDLNANVSVHCRVSETSTTLNQPIMTPVEMPSNVDSEPSVPTNLEEGLAVIGVTPHSVPTSLELPITVTDPRIAPKATSDPLCSTTFSTTILPSPGVDMCQYVSLEAAAVAVAAGPISMPLLTDEEDAALGKSMPILTDEAAASSLERSEAGWPRPLLTPPTDCSEASPEIPLQPSMHISVNDLSGNS